MKPSRHLFELIKTLSKSEKRFLTIHANRTRQNEESDYMLLFKKIDQQEDYNEEEIKERLHDRDFIQRLPEVKNYLYNTILKVSQNYCMESNISMQIRAILDYSYILYNKNLHQQSLKQVLRARELAERFELFPLIIQALNWQIQTNLIHPQHDGSRGALLDKLRCRLSEVKAIAHYADVRHTLIRTINTEGFARSDAAAFRFLSICSGMDLPETGRSSVSTLIEYHFARGICHFAAGDCEGTRLHLNHHQRLFPQWESPLHDPEALLRYIALLTFHFHVEITEGNYQRCRDILGTIEELEHTVAHRFRPTPAAGLYATRRFLTARYHTATGNFDQAVTVCETIPPENGPCYLPSFSSQFIRVSAYAFFGVGDYEQTLSLIHNVINVQSAPLLHNEGTIHILNIVAHIELGNRKGLGMLVESSYRRLRNKGKLNDVERAFFRCFKRNGIWESGTGLHEALISLHDELSKILTDPRERYALDGFDLHSWVVSKLTTTPFADVVKQSSHQ